MATKPNAHPARQHTKPKKVDALFELRFDDPKIDRDAKLFEILKDKVRHNLRKASRRGPLKIEPSLYKKYRGNGFPLHTRYMRKGIISTNRKLRVFPKWEYLSPWLKVQIALLVLGERGYVPFRVDLDPLALSYLALGAKDPKSHLRDKLGRQLAQRFGGYVPMFFFVLEDLDKDGVTQTKPHAHGAIEVPHTSLPQLKNGQTHVALRHIAATKGMDVAQSTWAKRLIRDALKAAGGGLGNKALHGQTPQLASVWMKDPFGPLFNTQYVDYVFKNASKLSSTIGDRRLAVRSELSREAKKLWRLITEGEHIMALLLARPKPRPRP